MSGFETLLWTLGAATGTAGAPLSLASVAAAPSAAVTAAQVLGTVATAGAAGATILSGVAAKEQSKAEAAELQRQAEEERALASQKRQQKIKETKLLLSRSQAISAASGAGATDPTVLALEGGIEAEGYNQGRMETAIGKSRSNALQFRAGQALAEGNTKLATSLFEGGGTILSGVSPYFAKYGRTSGSSALRYG